MSRVFVSSLLFLSFGALTSLYAQNVNKLPKDSSIIERKNLEMDIVRQQGDTVAWLEGKENTKISLLPEDEFKPNSTKAVIYSAIFPGLGQVYNRKYWKLPIIYGGFLGLTYAITWNGSKYNDYSDAYKDIMNGGSAWKAMLSGRSDSQLESMRERYTSLFKRNRDMFRRNRDLAIICSVGVYALCMIDAYVDAQLYDFDISPDLSMNVVPVFWAPTQYSSGSIGLQCSIRF